MILVWLIKSFNFFFRHSSTNIFGLLSLLYHSSTNFTSRIHVILYNAPNCHTLCWLNKNSHQEYNLTGTYWILTLHTTKIKGITSSYRPITKNLTFQKQQQTSIWEIHLSEINPPISRLPHCCVWQFVTSLPTWRHIKVTCTVDPTVQLSTTVPLHILSTLICWFHIWVQTFVPTGSTDLEFTMIVYSDTMYMLIGIESK